MTMLRIWPILLLLGSNVFMTFAWYAHLKDHRSTALWAVVLASWGIAFFEYLLQVPANRLGVAPEPRLNPRTRRARVLACRLG